MERLLIAEDVRTVQKTLLRLVEHDGFGGFREVVAQHEQLAMNERRSHVGFSATI
jgi:hypothetical protein